VVGVVAGVVWFVAFFVALTGGWLRPRAAAFRSPSLRDGKDFSNVAFGQFRRATAPREKR